MDKFVVEGETRLQGSVACAGAKNAALPMMVATLLAPGVNRLTHVPRLRDIATLSQLLESLGGEDHSRGGHPCFSTPRDLNSVEAPYDLVKTMRASVYVLGPVLARAGRARVSLPGGCAWGPRPVNLHLKGMEALGARIVIEEGYIVAEAPDGLPRRRHPARHRLGGGHRQYHDGRGGSPGNHSHSKRGSGAGDARTGRHAERDGGTR